MVSDGRLHRRHAQVTTRTIQNGTGYSTVLTLPGGRSIHLGGEQRNGSPRTGSNETRVAANVGLNRTERN